MSATLTLNGSETLLVRESTAEHLEVEATYAPHGSRPPRHLHPRHDEHFTVLAGTLRVGLADGERDLVAGEELEIPRGTVHHMWNPGDEPATVRWASTPPGRTEEMFTAMDRLHRAGRGGTLCLAGVLGRYPDVVRPAAAPARAVVRALGALSRPRSARSHVATATTVALSAGIGYVGVSYLVAPAATAPSFGMKAWPQGEAAAFLRTKGARDLVSGLLPLSLLLADRRRALGQALTVIALVPVMDAALILASGGSRKAALAVHGATAVVVAATGALLLTEEAPSADATR